MSQSWGPHPQFKIEIGAETFTNDKAFNLIISRPENNVSSLAMTVDDYRSSSFEDVFDVLDPVTVSLRYGSDSWTKVFCGPIHIASPQLSMQGEVLQVAAWGKGQAIVKTHCNTSYGVESANTAKDTPKEVLEDLVDNYINKSFAGAATGYAVTKTKIADIHNDLSITNLTSPYLDNFTIINRVCDLVTAHVGAGVSSCHWFVDPDANLFVNTLGAHENNASGWPTYWNGSQADSTIQVKADMLLYDFRKNIEGYANKVVLCSDLRKPAYDYWTENNAASWGTTDCTLTNESGAGLYVVGGYSLKATPTAGTPNQGYFHYPSASNAAWNITGIGSPNTIPTLNFYAYITAASMNLNLYMRTDANDYYVMDDIDSMIGIANKWRHVSIPLGPYYQLSGTEKTWDVLDNGDINWNNINDMRFEFDAGSPTNYVYIDDIHFSGKLIREAYNSTLITADDEYQKVLRNDAALDDTVKAATDTGTIAALAKAELLRRQTTPIVATVELPLMVDALPGQLVHTHAAQKADNSYRIDVDYRIKELQHHISGPPQGCRTVLNLTDDLYNAHAFAAPTMASLLKEYAGALGHSEAKDLKGSGIDYLIPKLSIDYG